MPEIENIPVPLFEPLDPYHYHVDNRPILGLIDRLFYLNAQVDIDANILRDSIGTAGTLAVRLNQSLNDDGTLKTLAVDAALHSIAEHIDGGGYVRMETGERNKLSLIEAQATNLHIDVETISTDIAWPDDGGSTLNIKPSDTITWRTDGSGALLADSAVSLTVQAIHHYDITPVIVSGVNYKTTSINTAYKAGTLRVYVDGLRLTTTPTIGGFSFSETTPASGTFALNTTIGSSVLRIDFDQPL